MRCTTTSLLLRRHTLDTNQPKPELNKNRKSPPQDIWPKSSRCDREELEDTAHPISPYVSRIGTSWSSRPFQHKTVSSLSTRRLLALIHSRDEHLLFYKFQCLRTTISNIRPSWQPFQNSPTSITRHSHTMGPPRRKFLRLERNIYVPQSFLTTKSH